MNINFQFLYLILLSNFILAQKNYCFAKADVEYTMSISFTIKDSVISKGNVELSYYIDRTENYPFIASKNKNNLEIKFTTKTPPKFNKIKSIT